MKNLPIEYEIGYEAGKMARAKARVDKARDAFAQGTNLGRAGDTRTELAVIEELIEAKIMLILREVFDG